MPIQDVDCRAQKMTTGPYRYFFGYYDKSLWDATGSTLLALRVSSMDRPPTPEDVAVIGRVHLEDGCRWQLLAETAAWNWQQGTMLQWLPPSYDREIAFNGRERSFCTILIRTPGSTLDASTRRPR
jgi:hypothetical protein